MPQAVKALAAPAAAADGAFGPVPDEASLALIHRYTLAELPASSLYVRRMVLANDALDRTFERFPVEYLQRFAATLPGKSLLVAHDKTALATGLIYRAEVRAARPGEAGRHSLVASFYLPVTSGNEEVRALIDAGVIRHVSIGFTYDQRLCSVCGQDYFCCPHLPGETADDGQLVTYTYGGDPARVEAREASLVYLGAQREAVITKGDGNAFRQDFQDRVPAERVMDGEGQPSPHSIHHPLRGYPIPLILSKNPSRLEPRDMENEKALVRIRELSAQVQALTEQLAAAKAAAEEFQQEARALAEQLAALREQDCRSGDGSDSSKIQNPKSKIPDTPDLTHALIEDGQAYRERLRAEVQRLAGLVGSEAEASLLLSALPQAPAAQLQQLVDGYQARVEERFPPQPHGQPAALAAPDRKATPHQDPPSAGTRRRPVRLY